MRSPAAASHLVTVNDYLARRDAEWMGELYRFLGLDVRLHPARPIARRAPRAVRTATSPTGSTANSASITCATTAWPPAREQQVQRGHVFAIVDEVDSILIDEARTPLIIAGPATVSTHQYDKFKPGIEQLVRKQSMLCNRLVNEAKALLDDGKTEEAGTLLVQGQARPAAQQGAPCVCWKTR